MQVNIDRTEAAYRRSYLFARRRTLMQQWAEYHAATRLSAGSRSRHPAVSLPATLRHVLRHDPSAAIPGHATHAGKGPDGRCSQRGGWLSLLNAHILAETPDTHNTALPGKLHRPLGPVPRFPVSLPRP